MYPLLTNLLTICQTISNRLDELCKPNPKYFKDTVQHIIYHKRNKILVSIQIFTFFTFILRIPLGSGGLLSNIQGCVATLGIIVVNFVSCRYHHEIFKVFYNLLLLLYGGLLPLYELEGVHGAWFAALTFPIYVYLYTGSVLHYIFSSVCYTLCLNTIYQKQLERSFLFLTPEAYTV